MAQILDKSELVTFKELLMANSIQVDALAQLLIEERIIDEQKFYSKLKQAKVQYQNKSQ